MIGKKDRLVFFHIPKTAGRLIKFHCFKREKGFRWVKHRKCKKKKYEYSESMKFSIVRNPYDRFYSTYYYLVNGGISDLDKKRCERIKSNYENLKDFVMNINFQEFDGFFDPQHSFVCDDETGKECMDYVGRYENLEEDVQFVYQMYYQKRYTKGFPVVNSSNKPSWVDVLDKEMKRRIFRYYEKDFKAFGYDK